MSTQILRNVLLMFAVLSISCLVAFTSGQDQGIRPALPGIPDSSVAPVLSETTSTPNDTTTSTVAPTTSTTAAPDDKNTTTTQAPTPTPVPDNTTTTTMAPNTTTTSTTMTPDNTTTTTVAPSPTPSPTPTPTPSPSPSPSPAPTPVPHCKRFDGYSFVGGMILAYGSLAIALVLWKFYKARTERNYHTLEGERGRATLAQSQEEDCWDSSDEKCVY